MTKRTSSLRKVSNQLFLLILSLVSLLKKKIFTGCLRMITQTLCLQSQRLCDTHFYRISFRKEKFS